MTEEVRGKSSFPTCGQCGQTAHWKAMKDGLELGYYRCRHCKPDPWTAGSPSRQGVYYVPIGREESP